MRQLEAVRYHALLPDRFSAACITSTDGQMRHEFHNGILAEDRPAGPEMCMKGRGVVTGGQLRRGARGLPSPLDSKPLGCGYLNYRSRR